MNESEPPSERLRPNPAQEESLRALCTRYHAEYSSEHYTPQFDLPEGYVAGWVGGVPDKNIYVGCDPDGVISS